MSSDSQPLLTESTISHPVAQLSSSDSRFQAARQPLHRFFVSKSGHYCILLLVSLDVSCIFADFIITIFTCEQKDKSTSSSAALNALGVISLVFSSLFVLELLLSVYAFGPAYFKSYFHCFDALIILASFTIDVLLRGPLEEVASLVIILRLWRVAKIIEELSGAAEEQMDELRDQLRQLEKENSELRSRLSN